MNNVSHSEKQNTLHGILLLLLVASLWSTSGIGIKWVQWNPMAIAGVRSGVAALVIWLFFRKSAWQFSKLSLLGGISYAGTVITFVIATKMTTAANAILLQYTSPIYVAILGALFLKEIPKKSDWLTMGMVGIGMLLFFQEQMSPGNLTGNLIAVVCGIFTATTTVLLRLQKNGSPFGSVLLGNIFTFLCGLPFMADSPPNTEGWLVLFLLGCFQLGLPYALYAVAIKKVPALEAAIVTMIEPLLNPLWVFLLLGEKPAMWAIAGGSLILLAIALRYLGPILVRTKTNILH